jgi:hypothetical protein
MIRTRILVVALLLVALPAFGQVSENVIPDNDNGEANWRLDNGGTACSSADCAAEIDESPASPDGLEPNTATNNDAWLISFATPSTCTVPSGTQTFDTVISRCTEAGVETTGGTNPNYDIDLFCGGVSKASIASAVTVSTEDQRTAHTWTWDATCTIDNVEVQITAHRAGGGGNRRYPCVEAIEWECEQPAASTRRIW